MISGLKHPVAALLLGVALALLLLLVPWRLPMGANFWDLYFHLDAAYRIRLGQVPHVDFFSPAGPLPFYLLAAMERWFGSAAPLLQAQYGAFLAAALLLLPVCLRLTPEVRARGWLLTLPFVLFGLLPVNASMFFPAPGMDGIGLYNRQTGMVLYAFVAALWLMRPGLLRAVVLGLALTMLLFMKINGFAVAALLLMMALVSGKASLLEGLVAVAIVLAALVGAEVALGLVSAYGADIAAMLGQNAGGMSGRLLTLLSVKFDVAGPLAVLVVAALWHERGDIRQAFGEGATSIRALARLPSLSFAALALLMLVMESQNTGGQEFLPLWPALIPMLLRWLNWPSGRERAVQLVLIAAVTLPTLIHVTQAGARAVIAAPTYATIDAAGTEAAGLYSTKPAFLVRARQMLTHYEINRAAYAGLAAKGELPSTILYSDPDYQALHLLDLSAAIAALASHEQSLGKRYASLATLDANDLLPMLLQRQPVKGITISFDPARGYPQSEHPAYVAALASADAILAPHCPETPARQMILAIGSPALKGRTKIALNPCWDLYPK
jgi:hypothetical protein